MPNKQTTRYFVSELKHRYIYNNNGRLSSAQITDIDGEVTMAVLDAESGPA